MKLSVNIDHIATLRQARLTWEPDPAWGAMQAHLGGADGITVHLREDRRHIQDNDVFYLAKNTQIKFNFEMAATQEMLDIACKLKPHMAMLVPEGRFEVTTEGGLDVLGQKDLLRPKIEQLKAAGIGVSVFIDADLAQVEAASQIGASVCEIHTGPYAHAFHAYGRDIAHEKTQLELNKVKQAGQLIQDLGMQFNAGHALNYYNVQPIAALSGIGELHIGHSIISRSIFVGLKEAVREMKALIQTASNDYAQSSVK